MKVTPILYSRQLANKLYQIKIRIQTNGKTTFVNSGIEIEKNQWDKKTSRVKELKSIPHYEKQNSEIDRLVKLHKSEDIEFENDPYNFEKFISYFSSQIDILKAQEKYNTYRKYDVVKRHLKLFVKLNPEYRRINVKFIDGFKKHLFGYQKVKVNGFHSYAKVFRNYLNKLIATNDPEFRPEYNPFYNYKISEEKVYKEKLSINQIEKIGNHRKFRSRTKIWDARNLFLFAYYSGGMRIADLITLQWRNIRDGRLEYTMRKTKKQISMPLNERLLNILWFYLPKFSFSGSPTLHSGTRVGRNAKIPLIFYYEEEEDNEDKDFNMDKDYNKDEEYDEDEDYDEDEEDDEDKDLKELAVPKLNTDHPVIQKLIEMQLKCPNEWIFPAMNGFKYKNQIELNKKIQSATYVINKNLKQISIDCEIGMKISTHIARHSFSDNIRQSGENIYNISKILGHSDIAVTQKYLKSLDQNSVDESLNKFYNQ